MRYVSTLFACSLLSVGFAQVPEYVPAEGLVAWYPFNGNAQDESGNGHHAAIDGATLADDRYGNFDAAFYFDGSDRIIAPQNVSPDGNSARTINAFFKSYTALPVGNNQYSLQAIFGSGSAASGKVISTLNIDGNGTNNGHIPRTGHLYFSSGSWQDEAWSQTSVSDSLWHMATMTYEGANTPVRVYLDGHFQDQTDPITLNTHLSDFYIGDVPWATLFFNGLIDDLGVWNRALTDEEILSLYLAEEIIPGCTDPLACNFAGDANLDDGSCHFNCLFCQDGTVWDEEVHGCISANTADINNDGCVQLSDLLDLLGAYGACAEAELAENPCGGGAFLSGDDIACAGWNYLGAYDGGEYYVSSIPVAWDSAQAFAVELNGGLAVISSQEENDWISNLVGDNYVWIGLYQDLNSTYYSEPDGGWGWVNGAPFVYENWASNSPNNVNNGSEHHCQMYSNGLWNDAPGDLFINGSDGRDIYAVIEFR